MIYFTSDHHFGHTNIIKYSNRPYLNVNEMHNDYIQKWNEVVSKDDVVYYLGDFSFLDTVKSKEILSQLNGQIHLISGNHDKNDTEMLKMGFLSVQDSLTLNINGMELFLNHYPFVNSEIKSIAKLRPNIMRHKSDTDVVFVSLERREEILSDYNKGISFLKNVNNIPVNRNTDEKKSEFNFIKKLISRYIGSRPINEGQILIHGHTHNVNKRKLNAINVSVEAWEGYPASIEQVMGLINEYKEEMTEIEFEITKESYEDDMVRLDLLIELYSIDKVSNEEILKKLLVNKNICSLFREKSSLYRLPREHNNDYFKIANYLGLMVIKKNLKKNSFYAGSCRNARFALWDGSKFVYARSKFGSKFLEDIRCPEDDDGFDVFIPHKEIEEYDTEYSSEDFDLLIPAKKN